MCDSRDQHPIPECCPWPKRWFWSWHSTWPCLTFRVHKIIFTFLFKCF